VNRGEIVARCRAAFFASALAVGAAGAAAQDAWETLGPARIGAPRAEVEASVTLQCEGTVCVPVAGALTRVAGVPVQRVELRFNGGRLAQVTIQLAEQHYAALLETLRQKLGPGADYSYQARAGMAGEFVAGVFLWSGPDVALVLEQYAGKITRAQLVYGTPQALADLVRAKTATPRGARRDL
jgi:hypothetical protein